MKGFSAAHLLLAVFALVVGLVLGGLGPRGELRRIEKQLADLAERPCNSRTGADIAKIFQGRPWDDRAADSTPSPTSPKVAPAPEPTDEEDGLNIKFNFGDGNNEADPEDLDQIMDVAREALELRQKLAMAALEEDARPTPAQSERIDQTLANMNNDLIRLAEDFRDQVDAGEEPSRREAMLYAAETLDVFLAAEDDFRELFTDEQLNNLQEESLDPMSYVDPALMDVLADLNR